MKYEFVTDCVHSTYEKITALVERARPITYETFRKYVDTKALSDQFGYTGSPLTLKKDYAVRFYQSIYEGKRCVYMQHSAIEYIFCPA